VGAHGLSSRTSPVPPHVGHSIIICSGATGPGRLSRGIGCFPVPPQSGQGIVLGSSFIDFLCSVVETLADFAASACREMEQVKEADDSP
jgi:hypothetical protein